ncbi:pantoate--beta-alanine ligase [Mycobacterium xenopi 4042]|uniref:Pantothenate synthetase n=1 Tax=Mycobacterium xenopi 4042 TaxID=1299334 RepID=X7ZWP2_MYCXE|nr:pantoate--beta-alanine ligase [Mycobacterium xenopi 4042]
MMLVPTMGALHDGHLALVRAAKRVPGSVVVVSIFVNPLQFGVGEDLDSYPRTIDDDLALLRAEGVEVAFTPSIAAMYPDGPRTAVHPGPLGAELEGAARPTHFAGVLTAVLKLLQIVQPDRVFFGEKDYQQLVLVRQMAADLHLDVQVVGVPIVREPDGLAMSSRNRYLDPRSARRRRRCRRRCWRAGTPPRRVRARRWTPPAPCSMRSPRSTSTICRCETRAGPCPTHGPPGSSSRPGSARPDSWTTSPSKSELSPAATDGCPPAIGSANHVGGIDVTDHAQI